MGKKVQSRKNLARSVQQLGGDAQKLVNAVADLWKNQERLVTGLGALAKSESSLDDQVSVLTRLFMLSMNEIRTKLGLDPITPEEVGDTFADWYKFKSRRDAHEHNQTWVFVEDLSTLPEEPELKENAPDTTEHEEFGGDYVKSDNGDAAAAEERTEDSTDNAVAALSGMREQDEAVEQVAGPVSDVSKLSP
jgi:hypothetical protein